MKTETMREGKKNEMSSELYRTMRECKNGNEREKGIMLSITAF